MKKFLKPMTLVGLLIAAVLAVLSVMRKTTGLFFSLFTMHRRPTPTFRDHWNSVKDTFGYDTARDMDSPSIIAERRRDLGIHD